MRMDPTQRLTASEVVNSYKKQDLQRVIARNGEEALKLIESGPPDLVLLDVMMPLRSGYEVCQAIKARAEWAGVKIVMLSAKGRDTEVTRGLALGADLYVTKPFSTHDLMDKIATLVPA